MQQFRADSGTGFVTAAMAVAGCSMQFVLPNRTPLPATREAGLVQIANALKDDSQMAYESAMRERGWPEPRRQRRRTHAGENHRIESPSSGTHDWKMSFAAKLTAGQAEARIVLWAGNRTVSAGRADQVAQPMLANSRLGKLGGDTVRWQERNKPGRIQLRPQKSQGSS